MKNLSKTFLLVGGILSIICVFGFIGGGFGFIYLSKNLDNTYIMEMFKSFWDLMIGETDGQKIEFARKLLLAGGVASFVEAIVCIPTAIISFNARSKSSTASLVAAIVFGVISGASVFVILGGIFGLIGNRQEANRQRVAEQQQ